MLFLAIEVNLILWLALAGHALSTSDRDPFAAPQSFDGWLILVGVAWAAIVQHWAYYRLKKARLVRPANSVGPER